MRVKSSCVSGSLVVSVRVVVRHFLCYRTSPRTPSRAPRHGRADPRRFSSGDTGPNPSTQMKWPCAESGTYFFPVSRATRVGSHSGLSFSGSSASTTRANVLPRDRTVSSKVPFDSRNASRPSKVVLWRFAPSATSQSEREHHGCKKHDAEHAEPGFPFCAPGQPTTALVARLASRRQRCVA